MKPRLFKRKADRSSWPQCLGPHLWFLDFGNGGYSFSTWEDARDFLRRRGW